MNILQRIRLSVFPGDRKTDSEKPDNRKYFRGLLLHFRPMVVPERTLRLSLTWGLGGMAAVLVFVLFGTGLMLKFVYEPFPDRAYDSILYLNNHVPFGQLIRNIHRWSANGLLFVAFLHLLRVFYTGAFVAPRQFNWIIGLALFTAVIFSNFTGYLLPWDQLAYWAITISTSMLEYIPGVGTGLKKLVLGGAEPGPATIMNFYAIHTAILPALLLFVLPFHFWRVRRANGLVIPRAPKENPVAPGVEVEAMPSLIVREVTVTLVLLAVILLIAMFFDAPLADKANPGLSPNPTKAPWYFMGLQELLMHFHPLFSVFVIPLLLAAGRRPSLDGLNLEAAGIDYDNKGIRTDARLRTSNRKVYAAGDVAGGYQFTHVAGYHAGIVIRNALFRLPAKVGYDAVPWVTYTEPELANVGFTEAQAREAHGEIRILRAPFAENDRAQAERRMDGLIKAITRPNGRILGAAIVGPHAGELIQPWVLAISQKLRIGALAQMVAPYPTLGEIAKRAAGSFYQPKLFSERTKAIVRLLARFG